MSDQFYKLPSAGQSDTFTVVACKGQRNGKYGPQHLIEIQKNGQTMLYTPNVDAASDKFLMGNIGKLVSITVSTVDGRNNYDWSLQTREPAAPAPASQPPQKDAWAERDKVKQKSIEKAHDENIRLASFQIALKVAELNMQFPDLKPMAYSIYDLIVNDGIWETLKKSDWKADEAERSE